MRFVDECSFVVEAGAGGNGSIAFRREAHVPFGGPSGGDGGDGGSVILVGDEGKTSLLDLKQQKKIKAARGEHGKGSDCYGKAGSDERVRVPVGTIAKDEGTGAVLGELLVHGQELVVAQGGKGGRGNKHFATSTDRAPRKSEEGTPGVTRSIALELRVMADVGLLGFPNAGKSTFISSVSAARPKVADYPFTTLVPQLGVVDLERWTLGTPGETLVIADIPGLIEGASEGAGLGTRFLRHVKRSRALLHLVSGDQMLGADDLDEAALEDESGGLRDPLADYDIIRAELERFDPALSALPEVVALTKTDLPHVMARYEGLRARFAERGIELLAVSAPTRTGLREVLDRLRAALADGSGRPEKARD